MTYKLLALDLDVLARVRERTPNLHLMIPFVRTAWELEACLEAIDASRGDWQTLDFRGQSLLPLSYQAGKLLFPREATGEVMATS